MLHYLLWLIGMSRFPPRIPHKDINTTNFETGFDEEHIVGGLPCQAILCSCCFGVPRFPATLDTCGHLFCERCILEVLLKSPAAKVHRSGRRTAPCPICRAHYDRNQILTVYFFQKWSRNIFQQVVVRCPQGCGFMGSPTAVDEHQVYTCPKRLINCPNKGCSFVGEALPLSIDHFPSCKYHLHNCTKCNLPCNATPENPHDCIGALQDALRGICINYNIRLASPLILMVSPPPV